MSQFHYTALHVLTRPLPRYLSTAEHYRERNIFSRDIHTFSFSAKIQDGRQKWRKFKFYPFGQDTLVLPCGSKNRSKLLYLVRFSRYSHFLFSTNIQDGRQKWRKSKFFAFAQDTLVLTCGSKLCSKSHYLLRLSRYSHFFIYRKNPRWPPKVAKIEIFPLSTGHSCTTLWVKNLLQIALSLTVFEIFTLPIHFQNILTEIHFQTTDHVGAVEKVAEQHIGTTYSKCNSFRVIK